MTTESVPAKASEDRQPLSPSAEAPSKMREGDPAWAEQCLKMTTNQWADGILPIKFIELVSVGLNAGRMNLNPEGTRRHIRAALAAGASRKEIPFVLKCPSVLSIRCFSFNAALLIQEASMGSLEDFGELRKSLLVAFDAAYVHICEPGTWRHIKGRSRQVQRW